MPACRRRFGKYFGSINALIPIDFIHFVESGQGPIFLIWFLHQIPSKISKNRKTENAYLLISDAHSDTLSILIILPLLNSNFALKPERQN